MHDSEKMPRTESEFAAALQEFDKLWEMPGTPERRMRMDEILKEIESQKVTTAPGN